MMGDMERMHFRIEMSVDPTLAFFPESVLESVLEHAIGRLVRGAMERLKTETPAVKLDATVAIAPESVDLLTVPSRGRFDVRVVEEVTP